MIAQPSAGSSDYTGFFFQNIEKLSGRLMTHENCALRNLGGSGKLLNNLQGGRDTPKAAIKWVSPIHQRDTPEMLKYSLDKLVNMILNIATAVITAYLLSKMPPAEPERAPNDVCSDPGASSVSGVGRLCWPRSLDPSGQEEIGHRQHQAQRFAYGGDKAKFVLVVRRSFGVFGIDNEERNAGMLRDCVSAP